MNRLDAALALIHDAFEDGSLPKDYSICYPKLLLLKGDTATSIKSTSKTLFSRTAALVAGVLALKEQRPKPR